MGIVGGGFGKVDAVKVVVPEGDDVGAVEFFEGGESAVYGGGGGAVDEDVNGIRETTIPVFESFYFSYPLKTIILLNKSISCVVQFEVGVGVCGSNIVIPECIGGSIKSECSAIFNIIKNEFYRDRHLRMRNFKNITHINDEEFRAEIVDTDHDLVLGSDEGKKLRVVEPRVEELRVLDRSRKGLTVVFAEFFEPNVIHILLVGMTPVEGCIEGVDLVDMFDIF